jgi:hypothetical protein
MKMNRLIPCVLALMLPLAIVPTAMAQRATKKTSSPKVTGQKSTNVSPKGAPTQDDVEKAITDTFKENYKEPWMTSTDVIKVEFSELKIAPRTKRMGIQSSSKYDPGTFVYPVRVKVKVSVDRGRNGIDVKERGVSKYDSFFFYKDDFGVWTFKTGAL